MPTLLDLVYYRTEHVASSKRMGRVRFCVMVEWRAWLNTPSHPPRVI
jgi:hypothetical protein